MLVLGVEQPRQLAERHAVADRHREVADEARVPPCRATGPSIWKPPIGFGRSSTTTGSLRFAASSMHERHRRHVGVEADADVLEIDDDRVDPLEHGRGRPARVAVERVNRQPGLRVDFRRHVGVEHAADAVLRPEQRHQLHVLRLVQQVDGRGAVAGAAGVVRDEPDALALAAARSLARAARRGRSCTGSRGAGRRACRTAPKSRPVHAAVAATGRRRSGSPRPRPSRPARAAASRRPCRPGCTRFDRNTTNMPVAGSIHSDVPVKPVCPNEPTGSSSPRFDENDESMSQPRPRTFGSPPSVGRRHLLDRERREHARAVIGAAAEQHAAEDRQIGRRAEQPGVPGDAAHAAGGRIVHDAAQHLPLAAFARPRQRRQLSVGAMRGRSAGGGRNIVSFIPSGSKISCLANWSSGMPAHAPDDVAEQKEVDVAVDEALRRAGGRHLLDRQRNRRVGSGPGLGEIDVGPQPGHVRQQVADGDVRLAVALETGDERRDAVVEAQLALARPASSRWWSSRPPW